MKLLTHYRNAQKQRHPEIINWRENDINDSLFYSYRSTRYDPQTYPSSLHYHDYYELVIFEQGDIQYLCEGQMYHPQYGDVILIPPKHLHMSILAGEATCYRRHVFYLYADALKPLGGQALTGFLENRPRGKYLTRPSPALRDALLSLLPQLDEALKNAAQPEEKALANGYILQIFYLLNRAGLQNSRDGVCLPPAVREIQAYLDAHFSEDLTAGQVAERFYYSREYLSRLFRKYLHTTVGEYLLKRRVAHSQSLIARGAPLTEACFQSGFRNMSTFIRSFRAVADMTPSRYRSMLRREAAEGGMEEKGGGSA